MDRHAHRTRAEGLAAGQPRLSGELVPERSPVMKAGPPQRHIRTSITEDEARETAQSFLAAIGEENWVITSLERAGMLKAYYNVVTDDPSGSGGVSGQLHPQCAGRNSVRLSRRHTGPHEVR